MTISNKFGWMVLSCGNKSEMATGYATLYGDMAGGFAVIKDVPKTLVYALCRDLNARAGRDVIPQAVLDKPPSAELRPGSEGHRLAAGVRRARSDHRGLRRGRRVGRRSSPRAASTRARPPSRAHGRPQRVQAASGAAGSARLAQGVRQGPASADHQSLARLSRRVTPETSRTVRSVAAGARADRGDDRVRQHVRDRPARARARDAGRLHPVAVHDRHDCACADRVPTRLPASGCRRNRAYVHGRRVRVRSHRIRRLLVPERGSRNARPPRTPRSSPGLFVVFTPMIEVIVTRRAPDPRVLIAVVVSAVGLFLLTGASLEISVGNVLTLGCAVMFARWIFLGGTFSHQFDPIALTAAQMAVIAACAVPVVLVGGLGHVTGEVVLAAFVTGLVVQCACLHVAALGAALRRAEPGGGDPAVRAGRGRVRRLSRGRAPRRRGLPRRARHLQRDRARRVEVVAVPGTGSCPAEALR